MSKENFCKDCINAWWDEHEDAWCCNLTGLYSVSGCGVFVSRDAVYDCYALHVSDEKLKQDHFVYQGVRYVKCDECGKITSVDDCIYYGGEGDRMFFGGCYECFGGAQP